MKSQYIHPSDSLMAAATLSVSGAAEVAGFPLANLRDLSPANPLKLDATTGRLIIDHGSAKAVHLVALFHHNLDAGLDVRFEANATNSWGAPSFSTALTIGAKDTDGYRPNTYKDLSTLDAGGPPTYQFNSIVVADPNAANLIVGEIVVASALRTLVHNYSWNYRRADERPGRQAMKTRAGIDWTSPSIGRQRGLTGEVDTTDAGVAALSAWSQACGGLDQASVFIPFAADITDALFAKWTVEFGYTGVFTDSGRMPVGWLEVARGRPWP